MTYLLTYPETPGAEPTSTECATLRQAREMAAAEVRFGRKDLTYQDIRIERADGTLVEYAGPCR